ncbi:MAG TPA: serine/threonine-protein kinase [Pseudonocardiaceae bacterium]|nr:serine/threonine-protein kinase [Pseudonocardiaceae bacterium]
MTDVGEQIGDRYRLVARIGSGAMGVVWHAHDILLNRAVAVKELLIHGGMTDTQQHEANQRALREGRIAARLHHPHAISVYDVVEHAGRPCLIMEYLPSRSLSDLLAEQRVLPVHQVGRIGAQIASALAAAHAAGIVHRDVKPGNVLLAEDGTAKLTDFGISRAAGDSTITATGILAGTPAYLAPEVAQGHDAGYASDVFSLGATLYAAVEGQPPFGQAANPIALLYRIANESAPPPRQAGALTEPLARMLRSDPDRRPTAREAEHALAGVTQAAAVAPVDPPDEAPPPIARGRKAIVAALVVGVLVVTGVLIAIMNSSGSNTAGASHPTTTVAPAPPPHTATTTTTTTTRPPPATTPQNTGDQLVNAIVSYYQLVPGDLTQAWTRLTPDYQRNHAGGLTGYQRFWQPVSRVSASDVTVGPPGTVDATIRYAYADGHVVTERTRFGLVQQGGTWQIASSSVLSHQG